MDREVTRLCLAGGVGLAAVGDNPHNMPMDASSREYLSNVD